MRAHVARSCERVVCKIAVCKKGCIPTGVFVILTKYIIYLVHKLNMYMNVTDFCTRNENFPKSLC